MEIPYTHIMPRGPVLVPEKPEKPEPIKIQPRDIDILYEVLKNRFVTTPHLAPLLKGPPKKIYNRCRKLTRNGYLIEPPKMRTTKASNDQTVYALAKKGADLLRELNPQLRIGYIDFRKESDRSYPNICHTLGVTVFLTSLRLACRRAGIKVFWNGQFARNQYHVSYTDDDGQEKRLLADAFFELERPDGKRAAFFLELDRERKKGVNYFRNRYEGYYQFWKSPEARQKRPYRDFGVLTVAGQHPDDMHLYRNAAASLELGDWSQALFFSHLWHFELENPDPILGSIWLNPGDDTPVSLI